MEILDLRRAVQNFPVSVGTIRKWITEKRLPAFRLDGKLYLRQRDIRKLLLSQHWNQPRLRGKNREPI